MLARSSVENRASPASVAIVRIDADEGRRVVEARRVERRRALGAGRQMGYRPAANDAEQARVRVIIDDHHALTCGVQLLDDPQADIVQPADNDVPAEDLPAERFERLRGGHQGIIRDGMVSPISTRFLLCFAHLPAERPPPSEQGNRGWHSATGMVERAAG